MGMFLAFIVGGIIGFMIATLMVMMKRGGDDDI